ncbi:MAG TPA: GAF domain-containing protein [Thermoleophilaceae bacterium]|nr:GAF domain-containing protein [Thermoleophilaceae bacterium]
MPVAMHATTVRFTDDLWELLEGEAARQGVSVAQFVRDAALFRVASVMARRGEEGADEMLERLAADTLKRRNRPAPAARDPRRLKAVRQSGLLDSAPEPRFDRLTRVAARGLNAPVALVSIVDEDRQFLKSCVGVAEPWASRREMPLSHSYCQHAVASPEPLVVPDAREHPLLRESAAIREFGAIAYAGVPLVGSDGQALGTLCVIDHGRREWNADEVALLGEIADAVLEEIERGSSVPASRDR